MNRRSAAPGVFQMDKCLIYPAFGKEMGLDFTLLVLSPAQDDDILKRDVFWKPDLSGQDRGISDKLEDLVPALNAGVCSR